jgi:uncharacterized protein DUF5329
MRLSFFLLVLAFTIPPLSVAAAEKTDPEIEFLIGYVEHSNARFIRGGKEYSAKEGADHMRLKLGHAGGRVKTADDFIKGIATKSFLTGKPYSVKFADGRTIPTGQWLSDALARHRARSAEPR